MNYQPLDDLLIKWKREVENKKRYRAILTTPLEQYKLGEQIIQKGECAVELIEAIQKIKREEEDKLNKRKRHTICRRGFWKLKMVD